MIKSESGFHSLRGGRVPKIQGGRLSMSLEGTLDNIVGRTPFKDAGHLQNNVKMCFRTRKLQKMKNGRWMVEGFFRFGFEEVNRGLGFGCHYTTTLFIDGRLDRLPYKAEKELEGCPYRGDEMSNHLKHDQHQCHDVFSNPKNAKDEDGWAEG
jgi:hypothetical protein